SGFTLTEIMIAVTISVLIFSALGMLLSRCFSLWLGSQAEWKLAQHARVTRTRLLYGGFGTGTGLLNSTNVTFDTSGGWRRVEFYPVTGGGDYYRLWGSPGSYQSNIWIERENGYPRWAWAQEVRFSSGAYPAVLVNDFSAARTNTTVTLSYTLNLSALGKTYELPQVVQAELINE
ncbi:MAG TPA: prepilin-type N-terminal cleavage/methylation domain-containing protein, partial [Tichowtungia sp.]|nr:prepilin-type N-terminal cleavage/methylation domain-containing protein [Tichowtungia sp.]